MKIFEKRGRGRPRAFDRDLALERAMELFREHGFEGTSLSDLTQAMGLSPSSLYATFGDKEALYRAAVERYLDGPGAYMARVLALPGSAREVYEQLMTEAANQLSGGGCMVALGALHCSPQARAVQDSLLYRRRQSVAAMAARIPAEELPFTVTPFQVASFYMAVLQGMSVQARDGAQEAELLGVARLAMAAWPED